MRIINLITDIGNALIIKLKWGGLWRAKMNCPDFSSNKSYVRIWYKRLAKAGSWIGHDAQIASLPCFPHGCTGVFISGGAKIGRNAVIFQQVTIGSNTLKGSNVGSPTIGDNCYIGAGAKIIGNVKIGNNCRIGANACVYKDMPDNSVAVCASTRMIQKENLDNRFFSQRGGKWVYYDNGSWRESELEG